MAKYGCDTNKLTWDEDGVYETDTHIFAKNPEKNDSIWCCEKSKLGVNGKDLVISLIRLYKHMGGEKGMNPELKDLIRSSFNKEDAKSKTQGQGTQGD